MLEPHSAATHIPPNAMSAEARVSELINIIAIALVRVRASAQVGLANRSERSVYASTNPGHTGR
jgi:hypothetical protein